MNLLRYNDEEWEILIKISYYGATYMLLTSVNNESLSLILKDDNGNVSEIGDEFELKSVYNRFIELTDEMTDDEKERCYFLN